MNALAGLPAAPVVAATPGGTATAADAAGADSPFARLLDEQRGQAAMPGRVPGPDGEGLSRAHAGRGAARAAPAKAEDAKAQSELLASTTGTPDEAGPSTAPEEGETPSALAATIDRPLPPSAWPAPVPPPPSAAPAALPGVADTGRMAGATAIDRIAAGDMAALADITMRAAAEGAAGDAQVPARARSGEAGARPLKGGGAGADAPLPPAALPATPAGTESSVTNSAPASRSTEASALHTDPATLSAITAPAAPARREAVDAVAILALPAPVDAPEFPQQLAVHVSVLARQGVQQAELHLNPAEMGPVSVQIAIDGTHARVQFGADAAATRQVIEGGLPELAASLRDVGLTLTGGGVSEHAGGRAGAQGQPGQASSNGAPERTAGRDADDAAPAQRVIARLPRSAVDLYA